ncbi:MAG: 3-hydroxyisobutyrate dehydrogenase [Thermoleophilaceae bacterium]|nr:3-hydroxyisobutyrate dehydrogenase [Thermoleophilaceae bacterium]
MSDDRPTVAVLGTGTMGAPMARNLVDAGFPVRAWNRSADKAEAIEGVDVAETPAAAAKDARLVVTMLADGTAVEKVASEAEIGSGSIWLQMSTVGIAATEGLQKLAEERDVPFVDAPVLGTKQPAEKGELIVLASGPKDAREEAKPLFEAVGSKTIELGDAGEGTRLKLVLNSWLVTLVAGLAETIAFAETIGIDPQKFLDTIDGGPLSPAYAQLKGKAMIEREFPPAFALKLAHKDAGLVLEAAERHGFDAALARVIAGKMEQAIEDGHGDEDMAATIEASRSATTADR